MNTTATNQVYGEAQRAPLAPEWSGATCEALTAKGARCTHAATVRAASHGLRTSGLAFLCKSHARSRYTLDVIAR